MVTPELEQPDDSDAEPASKGGPGARDTASSVVGGVVKAGVVHGDVHPARRAPPPPAQVIPRQLPAAPGLFAGRAADLAGLDRALITAPNRADNAVPGPACADLPADLLVGGATVVVSAIGGARGSARPGWPWPGRTAHLDRLPDVQLFVDLRGFSPAGEPMAPGALPRAGTTTLPGGR